jgi:hypothetical protein
MFRTFSHLKGFLMIEEAISQRELIAALHLENLFVSQQLSPASAGMANDLRPTRAESERAVANIRAWQSYLPAPCVARMIDDGWQWST